MSEKEYKKYNMEEDICCANPDSLRKNLWKTPKLYIYIETSEEDKAETFHQVRLLSLLKLRAKHLCRRTMLPDATNSVR